MGVPQPTALTLAHPPLGPSSASPDQVQDLAGRQQAISSSTCTTSPGTTAAACSRGHSGGSSAVEPLAGAASRKSLAFGSAGQACANPVVQQRHMWKATHLVLAAALRTSKAASHPDPMKQWPCMMTSQLQGSRSTPAQKAPQSAARLKVGYRPDRLSRLPLTNTVLCAPPRQCRVHDAGSPATWMLSKSTPKRRTAPPAVR